VSLHAFLPECCCILHVFSASHWCAVYYIVFYTVVRRHGVGYFSELMLVDLACRKHMLHAFTVGVQCAQHAVVYMYVHALLLQAALKL
jgi:hypothetical protein